MFTFINTLILSALFAALIPLLIHLFNRQRTKRVPFSSIRFLKLLEKQRLKKLRLYQILLILLRTLLIIFLVLAFARPTFTETTATSDGSARTTAVIVVDNGVNMNRYDDNGLRFARALKACREVLRSYTAQDQVFIIPATEPQAVLTDTLKLLKLRAGQRTANWPAVLDTINRLFKKHVNYNNELIVISDFEINDRHRSVFESMASLSSEQVRTYFVETIAGNYFNIAVDSIYMANRLVETNTPLSLRVRLRSEVVETQNVDIHLFVNGSRQSHRRISLSGLSSETVEMTFVPGQPGWKSGYVEIPDDDFLPDNRRYFAFTMPDVRRILFVGRNNSVYLEAALEALQSAPGLDIKSETYASFQRLNFDDFQVICLSDPPTLSAALSNRLVRFMRNGGGVVLFPGEYTSPVQLNQFLKSAGLNFRIGELVAAEKEDGFFTLKDINFQHPLFRGIFRRENPQIETPGFYRYFKVLNTKATQRDLVLLNNDPLLVSSNMTDKRLYLLTSFPTPLWNELPFKGLFIPLLTRMITMAASGQFLLIAPGMPGEKYIFRFPGTVPEQAFSLTVNATQSIPLQPEVKADHFQFSILPSTAGLYTLASTNRTEAVIPVNIDNRYLQNPHIDKKQLRAHPGKPVWINDVELEPVQLQEARFGKELWKLFVFLAVLCLIFEIFVVKKMEGRNQQ